MLLETVLQGSRSIVHSVHTTDTIFTRRELLRHVIHFVFVPGFEDAVDKLHDPRLVVSITVIDFMDATMTDKVGVKCG